MKKIRAGVVGVGFIGAAHIEALRRIGNIEVAAISDDKKLSKRKRNNWEWRNTTAISTTC